jgi:hypothetical protein
MTDIETFCDMLRRAGIEYRLTEDGNFYNDKGKPVTAVELEERSVADFTFDKISGSLQHAYIWPD